MYFKTVMRLWKDGKLPMINGLLKSDDSYFSFTDSGLLISSPLRMINAVNISDVDSMPPLQQQHILFILEKAVGEVMDGCCFLQKE